MKKTFFILILAILAVMLYAFVGRVEYIGALPPGALPNRFLTPGVENPNINQTNIGSTLCNPKWSTKSIRPTSSYTTALKIKQIKQYGYADTKTASYEEDHLISLELGGSPTDPKNLWPEAYPLAHAKDAVENQLHKAVCDGTMTLGYAQAIISVDWYSYYLKQGKYGSIEPVIDADDE